MDLKKQLHVLNKDETLMLKEISKVIYEQGPCILIKDSVLLNRYCSCVYEIDGILCLNYNIRQLVSLCFDVLSLYRASSV